MRMFQLNFEGSKHFLGQMLGGIESSTGKLAALRKFMVHIRGVLSLSKKKTAANV